LWETDLHLFGLSDSRIHLFGTEELGRDLFTRILYGTRISLSIGVLGVLIAFVLGLLIGGISGYTGGWVDNLIQRFTELIRSIPSLPLWMALSASLPKEWSGLQVYLAITVILGFLGWTSLARRVRSKLLSLNDEDFVMAARIAGCTDARIIFRHMLPSFISYLIVDITVAFPNMLLAETTLSFIGLGLRPPIVSWGVLLQSGQNIRAISMTPWLLMPVFFVILAVLTCSFVGDGLRDAADPYSR
jgi:peptide/nickel transport system permease protein